MTTLGYKAYLGVVYGIYCHGVCSSSTFHPSVYRKYGIIGGGGGETAAGWWCVIRAGRYRPLALRGKTPPIEAGGKPQSCAAFLWTAGAETPTTHPCVLHGELHPSGSSSQILFAGFRKETNIFEHFSSGKKKQHFFSILK